LASLLAQSRHAQCADECPLLGEKRALTNRCLPISIYEYTPVTGVDDYALLAASFQAAVSKARELKWIA
jgi:hypothetical protein